VITDAQYGDFEVIVEMNNDFGPDSGLFLRSNDKGQAYQYLVDYHANGNIAGLYGEGLKPGFHLRNFDFTDKPSEIKPHEAPTPLPIKPEDWPKFWKHGEWHASAPKLSATRRTSPPGSTTSNSWIGKTTSIVIPPPRIALQVHGGGDFTKQFVRYKGVKIKELK